MEYIVIVVLLAAVAGLAWFVSRSDTRSGGGGDRASDDRRDAE